VLKFRGKSVIDGEWVEGNILNSFDGTVEICYFESVLVEPEKNYNEIQLQYASVIPETVGQFTGIKCISDRDIYEGHKLGAQYSGGNGDVYKGVVTWNEGEMCWYFAGAPLWTWENIQTIIDK
jgi:hypothetical protein